MDYSTAISTTKMSTSMPFKTTSGYANVAIVDDQENGVQRQMELFIRPTPQISPQQELELQQQHQQHLRCSVSPLLELSDQTTIKREVNTDDSGGVMVPLSKNNNNVYVDDNEQDKESGGKRFYSSGFSPSAAEQDQRDSQKTHQSTSLSSYSPKLATKECAVCDRHPPTNTLALRFGPKVVRKRRTTPFNNTTEAKSFCCCRECFDFFRCYVSSYRDKCLSQPELTTLTCLNGTGSCVIGGGNEINRNMGIEDRCHACWLDRCILAGLCSLPVATEGVKWVSQKVRDQLQKLDLSFKWRREVLRSISENSLGKPTFNVGDEKLLEFSLLSSMTYIDQQLTTLRLACSSSRRINRVFKMFEHFRLSDLTGTSPILMGTNANQKRILIDNIQQNDCTEHFDCVLPSFDGKNSSNSKSHPGYVSVHLEHNDPIFVNVFYSYLDIFLCFEIAHTMPVFQLLDPKDKELQLAYKALFCRALAQATFSASLGAPEMVQPGGDLSHRTLVAVLRKASKAIEKNEQEGGGMFSRQNVGGNAFSSVEMVPLEVLASFDLLSEMEERSREMRVEALQPFLRAKLSTTEVLLLRAIIITSPDTPGLSENARLLLGIEQNKYVKLLRNHLRGELDSKEAVEHRLIELLNLLDAVADVRELARKIGWIASSLFKVPVHRHPGEREEENRRAFPPFAVECSRLLR